MMAAMSVAIATMASGSVMWINTQNRGAGPVLVSEGAQEQSETQWSASEDKFEDFQALISTPFLLVVTPHLVSEKTKSIPHEIQYLNWMSHLNHGSFSPRLASISLT